ncbi:hypothetical protein EV1_031263 [Malus domestica]
MASLMTMLRSSRGNASIFGTRRWAHIAAMPPPMGGAMPQPNISPPPLVLPESDPEKNKNIGFGFPSFLFSGSMELMAVPKRKTSPHKRGIRNGPKALKPVPVIVRCRGCGRVKLPHFYCCSGRENAGEHDGSRS